MVKYLIRTFLYNFILTFIICSLYCIIHTPQQWTSINTLLFAMICYTITGVIMLIPFCISKKIYPSFKIIENIILFSILIITVSEFKWIYKLSRLIKLNISYNDNYPFILWIIIYIIYLVIRPYMKRHTSIIMYITHIEDFIMSKKGHIFIICIIIFLLSVLIFKDVSLYN